MYEQEDPCPMGEIQLRPQWGFRPRVTYRSFFLRSIAQRLQNLRDMSQGDLEDHCSTGTSSEDSTGTVFTDRSSQCSSSTSSPVVTIPRVSWARIEKGRFLGEGAYGSTYQGILSQEDGPAVDVAIKIIHVPDEEVMLEACLLEALAGAGGVPRLFGVTEEAPEAIVMEFCPGQVLRRFLQTRPLLACVEASLATFEALEEFHEAGYAHRDLHQDNIIVHVDGNQEISVRIIDVGLALPSEDDFSKIRTEGDILDLYDIALELAQFLDEKDDHYTYTKFRKTLKRIREEYLPEESE